MKEIREARYKNSIEDAPALKEASGFVSMQQIKREMASEKPKYLQDLVAGSGVDIDEILKLPKLTDKKQLATHNEPDSLLEDFEIEIAKKLKKI